MKKIAVFMGELPATYQTEITEGIIAEASAYGVQCVIISNNGVYGQNVFFAYGEKNVIYVPYLEDYDGIVVAGDTFGIDGMYEEVADYLETEAKCPVVCLRQKDERFYNVLVDNRQIMSDMVEHFISHHGFTKISFMTGKLEMYDAQRRLLGYIDTMQKHGLKVTPDMVFEGDYWKNRGTDAVEWFCKDKDNLPQAIVCANDYMAISVCNALHAKGIRVPEEMCVSGYDDIEEARYTIPSISSMHVAGDEMGRAAFHILKNLAEGKEQEKNVYVGGVTPCYRGSCGCAEPCDVEAGKVLLAQKENIQKIMYHSSSMNIAFDNEESFYNLMMVANAYIRNFYYDAIYLCFCDEKDKEYESADAKQEYTEQMHLRAIFSKGGEIELCDESFMRRDILPAKYMEKGEPVYIMPFHEKNHCLGYIVLKIDKIDKVKHILTMWVQALANNIGRQRMYEASNALQEIRKNYYRDALTGIGNRREIEKCMNQCYDKLNGSGEVFCIVSIDMDGLKSINDRYGHLEGDVALCTLANILAEVVGAEGNVARTGGDEYMACLRVDSEAQVHEYVSRIRTKIDVYNLSSHKPWELSASVGYAFCRKGSTLLFAMQQADKNMYQEKRGKKNTRLRKNNE